MILFRRSEGQFEIAFYFSFFFISIKDIRKSQKL